MLYLTLEDDPFPTQEHDEDVLLELVRTVARRNTDDRSVSELIRLRDSLDRLGLLWTPFDMLDKYQSIELARNLHLELAAPGDMIYLKQAPAMRSYVLLRGAVLLSSNVLDREGSEGTRLLVPGNEFGAILDPDLDPDQPVAGFEEYAKAPHIDAGNSPSGGSDAVNAVRGGGRKDGRAELLVIGRQDWISTVQCSRSKFAEVANKDTAGKDRDDLKTKARVAFNFPAKGRGEEHLAIARQYLTERVPFCSDLPEEPLLALASALEIYGLTVPRRTIFRRGRECYGEAYIMFTGSADQKGGEPSEDRLIKEGDLFGDDHFGVGDSHTQDASNRTATVSIRMAPCELLVLPASECRRLQAFMAVRNSEKAKLVFENFFHNLPSDTSLELSLIANIRKINMHEKLASEGDGVTSVFFVFRGECLAKSTAQRGEKKERRFGPGEIVGWPYLMPSKPIARPNSTNGARSAAGAHKSMPVDATGKADVTKPAKNLRPRGNGKKKNGADVESDLAGASVQNEGVSAPLDRSGKTKLYLRLEYDKGNLLLSMICSSCGDKLDLVLDLPVHRCVRCFSFLGGVVLRSQEWQHTITVTTPAQVLSISVVGLLGSLSERALQGLRGYISLVHKSKADEDDISTVSLTEADAPWGAGGAGDSVTGLEGFHMPGLLGQGGDSSKGDRRRVKSAGILQRHVGEGPESAVLPPSALEGRRLRTTPGSKGGASYRNPWRYEPRPNSGTNWRWRVDLMNADRVYRGSARKKPPTARVAAWDSFELAQQAQQAGRVRRERIICGCTCPVERCRVCLSTARLTRFHRTPAWAPSLPPRAVTLSSASVPSARPEESKLCTDRAAPTHVPASVLLREQHTPCADVDRGKLGDSFFYAGDTKVRGARDEIGAVRLPGGTHDSLRTGPTAAQGFGVEEVVKKGTALPKEEYSVTARERQGGRDLESRGEVAKADALTTTKKRIEQGSYTLVQLSTRKRLDASEPLATLFIRILGSFQTEAEAKTRVLNLYHCVLSAKLKWLPYQRSVCPEYDAPACVWDHMFLLRKGTPAQWLSFDVGTESIVDPIDEREGVGRGYDANFPAVFKAKGQHFAVAFVSSANRITQEWEQEQRRREVKRQQERPRRKGREVSFGVQPAAAPSTTTLELGCDSKCEVKSEGPLSDAHLGNASSKDESAPLVEDDNNSGSGRRDAPGQVEDGNIYTPDAPGAVEPQEKLFADVSSGVPEAVADLRVDPGSTCDSSSSHDNSTEVVIIAVGTEAPGGENEAEFHTRDSTADKDDRGHDDVDLEPNGDVTSRGTGGVDGKGAAAAGALSDAILGSAVDHLDYLLDKSDTESSQDDDRSRSQHCEHEGGLSHEDMSNGVYGCSKDEDVEQVTILPWAVSRMGMVEKVDGYHETEAAAFKKAVEILEKMERATSGTHIPLAPFAEEAPNLPQHQASRRVCVIPLYEWLSLGDGRIGGMERAIINMSVSDPSEATRAGVDPFTVWNNQRTRMLRANVYNLLRAAGSREIRSRCGLARNDGTAAAKGRGRQSATESGPYKRRGEDEDLEERAADSARRKKAAKEAVHRARDTVLSQNQKLIQTEMGARRRLAKQYLPPTEEDASLSSRPASVSSPFTSPRKRGEDRENRQRLGDVSSVGSGGRKAINDGSVFGHASAMRSGPGVAGRGGLRRELRVQMNIERKRARLFEDIRMLPYIGSTNGIKTTIGADGRQSVGKTRLPDHGKGDTTGSPGIVLRAAVVQAKTRLHGKPASSVFARAHITSAPAAVLKTTHEGEHDELTSNDGDQLGMGQVPEDTDALVAASKHNARHFAGKENQANSVSSVSTSSNPGTVGGASVTDASTNSRSEGGKAKGIRTLYRQSGRSTIRQESRRPGLVVTKRQVKTADSWSTSSTSAGGCNLDGELVLLDGILHDPKIKTWVETTLGPAKSTRP